MVIVDGNLKEVFFWFDIFIGLCGTDFTVGIQTNALLIDEKFIEIWYDTEFEYESIKPTHAGEFRPNPIMPY